MTRQYLDFEIPIKEIDKKIAEIKALLIEDNGEDADLAALEAKRIKIIGNIFSKLNRWQRVQLARHPERPYSLDYIQSWSPDFIELHGDRNFGEDSATIAGIGTIDGIKVAFVAQQKGRNTKDNIVRNFGMMRPEGYRKALRVMKLAEKFNLPIISLIDTPGAYPGIGAEERGQGEAIAKNLLEMSKLKTPIISIVIGEGASGGALGIGICDRMLMLENTWYSVISPEGCASILWHDASKAKQAAESLKLTPIDLVEAGICDKIVQEPIGGAHDNQKQMFEILKKVIIEELKIYDDVAKDTLFDMRIEKYDQMGSFIDQA
ncbi:MAG: acetyl-CoA carboxylase carboxyltransferase subunit alpha [Candidatus Marinimicrobia bacterium]|nr:acetyl-CoA carboxylase carboxyltransferase subunit alpha [Candidatus Neomarinimicrobiota bacterium]